MICPYIEITTIKATTAVQTSTTPPATTTKTEICKHLHGNCYSCLHIGSPCYFATYDNLKNQCMEKTTMVENLIDFGQGAKLENLITNVNDCYKTTLTTTKIADSTTKMTVKKRKMYFENPSQTKITRNITEGTTTKSQTKTQRPKIITTNKNKSGDICNLPFETGPCRAAIPKWYYDSE